jgi:hypothetical protein
MAKIYKVRGCDPLSTWDLKSLKRRPEVEIFVYNYQHGGYDGSGFALWKEGKKFGYTYLGHCSCYGPLEENDLTSILYTWTEIKRIVKANDWDREYAEPVLARMKEVLSG